MLFAKMRHGVVEIAAGDERGYVEPPALQRLHLLWTFRNFHRLSVSVLSHRQQQMLEQLSTWQRSGERVDPEFVIGRAEFSTYPRIKLPAPAESQHQAARRHAGEQHRKVSPSDRVVLDGLQNSECSPPPAFIASHSTAERIAKTVTAPAKRWTAWILAFASVVVCSAVALRIGINQRRSPVLAIKTSSSASAGYTTTTPLRENAAPAPTSRIVPASFRLSARKDSAIPLSSGSEAGLNIEAVHTLGPNSSSADVEVQAAKVRPNVLLAPRSVIYPVLPILKQAGEANRQILVRAIIDSRGTVAEVLVPGQDRRLAAAVTKAVRQWQYRPYLLNGQPAEVETLMIFTVLGQDTISVRFLPPGESLATP
jgi:TonB-like protein